MIKDFNYEHTLCELLIEMNVNLIFILTISLFVKIVSYFVFPAHISAGLQSFITTEGYFDGYICFERG